MIYLFLRNVFPTLMENVALNKIKQIVTRLSGEHASAEAETLLHMTVWFLRMKKKEEVVC